MIVIGGAGAAAVVMIAIVVVTCRKKKQMKGSSQKKATATTAGKTPPSLPAALPLVSAMRADVAILPSKAADTAAIDQPSRTFDIEDPAPVAATTDSSSNDSSSNDNSNKDDEQLVTAELQLLKMPDLRKQAAAAGANEDDIDDARDADAPKEAMIALIVAKQMQTKKDAAARQAATQRALTAELKTLQMPDLRKRAAAAGANEDDIEDARDADAPKEAMIALILSATSQSPAAGPSDAARP
jgi:hypothetical protein